MINSVYLNRISQRSNRYSHGFTIIELLIVVIVIGVLSSIAYPNYKDYVIRARIGEAVSNLLDMRTAAERFFQDKRTYAGMPCTITTPTRNFTFKCESSATTYTITAEGISSTSMKDFSYDINQINARRTLTLPDGWQGASTVNTPSTCWVLKRDGSC